MESLMTVKTIDPRTDSAWATLLGRMPSDVFQSPAWLSVLADTYGWTPSARVLFDEGGEPRAGLPFFRITDLFGDRIVTLPFSDYCDPLVADLDSWRCLTDELIATDDPMTVRCLHCDVPLADPRFSTFNRAKWHGIDLTPDLETLWNALGNRSNVTRSQRNGVTVRWATDRSDLRVFFDMHLAIRKHKYGMLAQPFSFFENIWRHFAERGQGYLLLAIHQGHIVSGAMLLRWRDTLYYKFNASSAASLGERPNDLLVWECLKLGKSIGCTKFDFGLSDWDQEGLLRFKRKFGVTEKTISFLRHDPDGGAASRNTGTRELLGRMTRLFVDPLVHDSVTERAGAELYRFFV
jgi:CelD/BcsL family acetyltransferase involved in cellulose biosynthesis